MTGETRKDKQGAKRTKNFNPHGNTINVNDNEFIK